jgi:hypothetical protein
MMFLAYVKWPEKKLNQSLTTELTLKIGEGIAVEKGKGKDHLCTGTEALYRPYGP